MAAWAVVLWALAAAAAVLGLRARRRAWLIRQVTAAAPVRPREDPDFAGSFLDRLGALTWRRWTRGLSRRLLPSAARRQLEHRLRLAGSARTPEAFFAGRLVLALVGAVAGAGLGLLEAHGEGRCWGRGRGPPSGTCGRGCTSTPRCSSAAGPCWRSCRRCSTSWPRLCGPACPLMPPCAASSPISGDRRRRFSGGWCSSSR
ncbi:protein of unknown function [Candidatus Hydrogenisulfobacillus filiaventi]|uniref:Uncharacterized protein n=1 Tax=Candidatus Hydrogenisulfobacillus filiaventi TaxID=2707344 RepID=A0A6F8ZDD9_9FIRM|nr:protein of unknown function [Candidatus Hydrogenisulfobacillus filiaventi]